MEIQIASDIHLEFSYNRDYILQNWQCKGDILILAGDIHNLSRPEHLRDFLSLYGKKYKDIYLVPGNHEFYGSSITDIKELNKKVVDISNCHIVSNKVQLIGSAYFFFTSLWTSMPADYKYVNDFNYIEGFTESESNSIHGHNLQFLEHELKKERKGHKIVVSHHLPTFDCISEKYVDSPGNFCFAANVKHILENYKIKYWIHGHSHDFMDEEITYGNNTTRFVRNPLGYSHANETYDFQFDYTITV